jgi:demethylmenaquinone methyltransferase/2-methoxy-6-polyprenyl-1,4-benzoquinol methylase
VSRPSWRRHRIAERICALVPLVTRLGTRNGGAELMMRYHWHTIDACVPPQTILGTLRSPASPARRHLLRHVQRYRATAT